MRVLPVVQQCRGDCCAVFWLPFTREALAAAMAASITARATGQLALVPEDGEFILDMMVPLTFEQAAARALRFNGVNIQGDRSDGWHHFACRHWNEHTRQCMVYDDRPSMCREYPYGRDCTWCGASRCGVDRAARALTRREPAQITAVA